MLGRISGKITTTKFSFLVEQETKKFEYIQVYHRDVGHVLCQIIEIIRNNGVTTAMCHVLGYKDESNQIKSLRQPFEPDAEVEIADDNFIKEIIKLSGDTKGAFIGNLDGRDIPIYLDLQNLLTKHVSILAKSGAGKSYCVGVLLEEIIEKNVPLLIIDPHGEYGSMKFKNTNDKELAILKKYGLNAKGFSRNIVEYGNPDVVSSAKKLTLSNEFKPRELFGLLPSKLSSSQEALLYSAMKSLDSFNFDDLRKVLMEENAPNKWHVISMIDYLEELGIFSDSPVPLNELIQSGRCSIINFKGISPEIQDIMVSRLLSCLFEERKKNNIPPFFCVLEETHNYCPEKSFSSTFKTN